MNCPACGCNVELPDGEDDLVECPCCATVWLADGGGLDRILVGPEG
ncbi:MAG: sulfonate ABC transporter [Actinobacteria bacterium]|nr:sulfonate ABC transporter [Actinomycetota bacterium]